jgi:hypothetical protein
MLHYCHSASAVLLVICHNTRMPKNPFTVRSTAVRQHNSFQKLEILASVSYTSSFDSKYPRYFNVVTCLFSVIYGWWHCQYLDYTASSGNVADELKRTRMLLIIVLFLVGPCCKMWYVYIAVGCTSVCLSMPTCPSQQHTAENIGTNKDHSLGTDNPRKIVNFAVTFINLSSSQFLSPSFPS